MLAASRLTRQLTQQLKHAVQTSPGRPFEVDAELSKWILAADIYNAVQPFNAPMKILIIEVGVDA